MIVISYFVVCLLIEAPKKVPLPECIYTTTTPPLSFHLGIDPGPREGQIARGGRDRRALLGQVRQMCRRRDHNGM